MSIGRRTVLKQAGLSAFTFVVAGKDLLLTPREARAADLPFRTLGKAEVAALDALGDTLLPGAAEAGISHYVDQQISIGRLDCLLTIRYLDVPPPYARFYQRALAGLDATASTRFARTFGVLDEAQRRDIVQQLRTRAVTDWSGGFPTPLVYFALRSDAVDVVYGTVEGFEKLGVPYMPHIAPTRNW